MPHSRLASIADAGHLPTLENPMDTAAEIIKKLEEAKEELEKCAILTSDFEL